MNLINQLINDDCFNVLPKIKDKSIDLILCDLPYGTTACKWDTVLPLDKLWEQYNRIIKDNGAIVLTSSQPFTTTLINSNIKNFKYEWIWEKNNHSNFQLAKKNPLKIHESVLVFYKKFPVYNPQGVIKIEKPKLVKAAKRKEDSFLGEGNFISSYTTSYTNYPKSILKFKNERGLHPTQKPVPLFEYLIKTYTNEQAIILDNCCGVATTAIAAMNTNRNYICIEQDVTYYNIGLKRIKENEK